jgi:hypothetical protein
MELDGFAGAAAAGNNARRNDQAAEEGQTGCADSASLQAASEAGCTGKSKVKLDKSARFGESLQLARSCGSAKVNVHATIGHDPVKLWNGLREMW